MNKSENKIQVRGWLRNLLVAAFGLVYIIYADSLAHAVSAFVVLGLSVSVALGFVGWVMRQLEKKIKATTHD